MMSIQSRKRCIQISWPFAVVFISSAPNDSVDLVMSVNKATCHWNRLCLLPSIRSHDRLIMLNVDYIFINFIFTWGQFWPSGIVASCVCLCVCPSVRQSHACPRDNSSPVSARITKFERCKRPWLRSLLFCGTIDHDLQGQIELRQNLPHFEIFHAITHQQLKLQFSKFGTKMHLSTVQIPANFGLDWNWSSIQFFISNPDQIELFMHIIGIL